MVEAVTEGPVFRGRLRCQHTDAPPTGRWRPAVSVRGGDRAVAENLPRAPAPRWLRSHPATTREDGQTFVDVAVDESELPSRAPVGSSLAR